MTASALALLIVVFFSPFAFAQTVDGQWHAGIGDPTLFGWITVVLYITAAFLSFKQYQQLKQTEAASLFWLYLAITLLLLSINKQLDLQTLLTQVLREHAFANGWYEQRRLLQSVFIVFLSLGMLMVLITLRVFLATSWRQFKHAWIGALLLCAFVLIRAASFHHFDLLIGEHFLGLRVNVVLEVSALMVIIIAALRRYDMEHILGEAKSRGAGTKIMDYLEVRSEEDLVACPKCTSPPIAKSVHGRLFKCKKCGHKFTLFIATY